MLGAQRSAPEASTFLIVEVGTRACAIPLIHVSETMRPLPIAPFSGAPEFVLGMSIIRGAPMPVIDLGTLIEGKPDNFTRFVSLRSGNRQVAFAVKSVRGVRTLDRSELQELPSLMHEAGAGILELIGASDEQLLIVLQTALVVPEHVWLKIDSLQEAR